MGATATERVKGLLGSVVADTDNSEYQFKLQTALQILEYIETRQDAAGEALENCDLEPETPEHVRQLGHLE